jgi:hypothetical protein
MPMKPLLAPPQELPARNVRARNLSRDSANRIHDDGVARTLGYVAGLVAGITVYGYLTGPAVAAWGLEWLARGTGRLALRQPVYDGDDLDLACRGLGRSGGEDAGEVAMEVTAVTPRGPAATLVAGLAWGAAALAPDPGRYPAAPPSAQPVAAVAEALAALDRLIPVAACYGPPELSRYADELDDPSPVYRGTEAVVHPALLLQQANRVLVASVALGPWIHAGSDVVHCGLARAGEPLVTRGRVARVFERGGHAFVGLEVLVVAGGERPVLHVGHTAIYRLRAG